jgi:hypothetical protein
VKRIQGQGRDSWRKVGQCQRRKREEEEEEDEEGV